MHAVVHRQYGTPDVLSFEEIEVPSPELTTCWFGCTRPNGQTVIRIAG